jgi:hypothetical protein
MPARARRRRAKRWPRLPGLSPFVVALPLPADPLFVLCLFLIVLPPKPAVLPAMPALVYAASMQPTPGSQHGTEPEVSLRPIRTDESNPFAHYTVLKRLPGVLDELLEGESRLSVRQREAVSRLRAELVEDRPLSMFAPPAPDWDFWQRRFQTHEARMRELSDAPVSPRNAEWFFFEHFLYRKLLSATDWWANGIDPFLPAKRSELSGEALWHTLGRTLQAVGRSGGSGAAVDALRLLSSFALWGNRIDLSYSAAAALGHEDSEASSLLADELDRARPYLEESPWSHRPVHLVADNAATELAADLALCDHLLGTGEREVFLHVKLHPTYVSDATPADVYELMEAMKRCGVGPGQELIRELGARLEGYVAEGRLRVVPDQFWNGPDFFDALPERLRRPFSEAALVVLKGDMNYRRLVGDVIPEPSAPLGTVAPRVPAAILLIRTMKGDPVAGLEPEVVRSVEAEDPQWRVSGRRGLIQLLVAG